MSSFFGLAEQLLSAAAGGGGGGGGDDDNEVRKTGGKEYNAPHHGQKPRGGFNTEEVLAHAGDVDEEDRGMITSAIQHVHSNTEQHHEEVDESSLAKYGPLVMSALSTVSSKQGFDVASLVSGGLGEGGGNQLMGLVMSQVGKSVLGGGGGGGEDKQSMLNGAAMTLAKLVAQKQLSAFVGGSNSGGLGMLEIGESLLKSRFG